MEFTIYYSLTSGVLLLLLQVVQSSPGLVLPVERTTGQGCIPEGSTVSYQCTVTDPLDPPTSSTVWQGSAFNCPSARNASNNRITLPNRQFRFQCASGACGSNLFAVSNGRTGNEYTSILTLVGVSAAMNRTTVECSLGDAVQERDIDLLKVGGLPPPPQCATVEVTSTSSLTVSWTPPSDTSNVRSYLLTVTGQNCGTCGRGTRNVSADTTNMRCSNVNQGCSFEVRAVGKDCGFISNPLELAIRDNQLQVTSLEIEDKPMFNTIQGDFVVYEVDANSTPMNLFLDCDVTGDPIITWYRDNEKMDSNQVLDNGTLVIANITEGEFASRTGVVYHCVATSIVGDPQFNATIRSRDITVYYAFFGGFLNATTMEPTTKAHTTVLPGAPGIDIAMECRVGESQPPPEIEWFRTSGGVTTRLTEVLLENNRWIYVRNIQNFTDTYHCEVANALIHQRMRSPETFSVDQNGLMAGQRYVYKRIGNLTSFEGNMDFVISYVSSNGMGNLQGVFNTVPSIHPATSNALGTITTIPPAPEIVTIELYFGSELIDTGLLTVLGRARITDKPMTNYVAIVVGQPMTFSCVNTGFPAIVNLDWYFNGVQIDSQNAIRIFGDLLIIDYPQVNNSGLYQCFVKNSVSEDNTSWLLEVRKPVSVCLSECDPEVLGPSPSSRNGPGTMGVANGMVTYNGVTSGSVATLSCDTGSSVANNYTRTCMSDGHWSEGTLSCVQDSLSLSENNALSFEGYITLSVVPTFVFTLTVGVFIGVLCGHKWRRSEKKTLQTETEMIPPLRIYEYPDDVKPDFQAQENVAYIK